MTEGHTSKERFFSLLTKAAKAKRGKAKKSGGYTGKRTRPRKKASAS